MIMVSAFQKTMWR